MTIKPDINIAARLTPNLQLTAVHFARVSGGILTADDRVGALGWHLNTVGVVFDTDDVSMRVIVPYTLLIMRTAVEGSPPTAIAQIEVFMRLDYALKKDDAFATEDLAHGAAVLGVMHSWPYLRSEVQALTAKMELPPLTLPTIVSGHVEKMATVRALTEAERKDDIEHEAPALTEQHA